MNHILRRPLALLLLLAIATTTTAFTTPTSSLSPRTKTHLWAQPKNTPYDTSYKSKPPVFNKSTQLWEPSSQTEPPPYGPFGSFLRGGPPPFLVRLLNEEQYEQAVFKYMAQTSCSRAEAMGNMDAFFANAADWAYQKQEEANGRPKVDYTQLKPAQAIKVITWAAFVTPLLIRCTYLIGFTDKGWGITVDDIFHL